MKTFSRLIAALALLTFAGSIRAEPVTPRPAPTWKLMDVDGKVVRSDQFKGKVVVVDFWATWCPPCRAEIPGYIALQDKYRDQGLVFVGISLDQQGPGVVKKFIAEHHVNYVVVMADDDTPDAFAGPLRAPAVAGPGTAPPEREAKDTISAIPTTFIIDRAGNIRDRKTGAEDTATYEKTILKYLK